MRYIGRNYVTASEKKSQAEAVFPETRQRVTQFGFGLALLFGCGDIVASDVAHRPACQYSIGHCGDHEVAGDRNRRAEKFEVDRPADDPEDADKCQRRQERRKKAYREIDRGLARDA